MGGGLGAKPLYSKRDYMKIFFFLFSIILFVTSAESQIIKSYGLKLGVTSANQNWDYSINSGFSNASFDSDYRIGLNVGLFAEFLNLPFISVVAEANYFQKGMKDQIPETTTAQPDGTGKFITWDTRVDYINISAFGKFRFDLGILSPYVLLGPKIDFELNKKNSLGPVNEVEENFKKNRFGFKLGAGSEIDLGSIHLLAELLYEIDTNELYKSDNLKVKSNSFDLRVGIFF